MYVSGAFVLCLFVVHGFILAAESQSPRIVCLMYHRFASADEYRACTGKDRIYTIGLDNFDRQLGELRRAGYRSVRLNDAIAFAEGDKELADKSVLITIDDGCCSVALAEPILRKHGFGAALFVTTDSRAGVFHSHSPGDPQLSAEELRRLPSDVFEIGSHAVTHRPLTDLPDREVADELIRSRDQLQHICGRPVTAFAAPGNWYDERICKMARDAGYTAMFTSDLGSVRPGADMFRLPRMNVAGYVDSARLVNSLSPGRIAAARSVRLVRDLPRAVFGKVMGGRVGAFLGACQTYLLGRPIVGVSIVIFVVVAQAIIIARRRRAMPAFDELPAAESA
jgi:peptidoglycan/xylan/chitin deacetylase (PgdA/CDA1 family)